MADWFERDTWQTIIGTTVGTVLGTVIAVLISWWFYRRALKVSWRMFRTQYLVDRGSGDVTLNFEEGRDEPTGVNFRTPLMTVSSITVTGSEIHASDGSENRNASRPLPSDSDITRDAK